MYLGKRKITSQIAWAAATLSAATVVAAGATSTGRAFSDPPQEAASLVSNAFNLSAKPPKGAVVLFSGDASQIGANWTERYTTDTPGKWTVDTKGVATPEGHDLSSRQAFGDCVLHAEFMIPKTKQKMTHGGNAGVALQGRYEIQIFDSYGKPPESHGCGAFYSQKAPLVNASKPAGEWQSYNIIFRAPRFGPTGEVTEKPRATVFLNGVLVQNNEEFPGMTGIQYSEYKTMAKTGPIVLQGNHDPIPLRNIWVVPLPTKE